MLHFPILKTNRITVQLKELSIGDSIRLAAMPEHLKESGRTAFLNAAIESVQGENNPQLWTAQERLLVTAHYLTVVSSDDPNFSIGEKAKFFDYVDFSADISKSFNSISVGEVAGEQWTFSHLTGAMLESIERLAGEMPDVPDNMHWILGVMAAQLTIKGENNVSEISTEYEKVLLNRMHVFNALPESDFELLLSAYYSGKERLHHLFYIDISHKELVSHPREADGGLPPATFPFHSCLSQFAKNMVGKYD